MIMVGGFFGARRCGLSVTKVVKEGMTLKCEKF
jgi:hypothetical protein